MLILSHAYLWIKAFHIIFIICWMAALLYLPRLFVYHTQSSLDAPSYDMLLTMERRLIKAIMNPSGFLSILSGILLLFTPGTIQQGMGWHHAKISLVILLVIGHGLMVRWYYEFKTRTSYRSGTFFRLINEIPAVIMIGIVILVVLKPF